MIHRLGPPLASLSVLLALVLFVLAGLYTFRQQDRVDARLCQSSVDNRDGLRDTWEAARTLILRGQTDQRASDATNAFFDSILATIPELECVNNKPVVRPQANG